MPLYVYRCSEGHEQEITRKADDSSPVICSTCMATMWRKPQRFTWYHNPYLTALDMMDENYRKARAKRRVRT